MGLLFEAMQVLAHEPRGGAILSCWRRAEVGAEWRGRRRYGAALGGGAALEGGGTFVLGAATLAALVGRVQKRQGDVRLDAHRAYELVGSACEEYVRVGSDQDRRATGCAAVDCCGRHERCTTADGAGGAGGAGGASGAGHGGCGHDGLGTKSMHLLTIRAWRSAWY